MTEPRETPRTDREWAYYVANDMHDAGEHFARELEAETQELAEALEKLVSMETAITGVVEEYDKKRCECDPGVGAVPCLYCITYGTVKQAQHALARHRSKQEVQS